MIGMQYKVILPKDYDMGIIRKRVQDNRHKTDRFPGLNFKMYLITEGENNLYKSYAPLYLWNNYQGMNKFIFEGYFDNILTSFGWKQIQIGVPYSINLDNDLNRVNYVVEYAGTIPETNSLINTVFNNSNDYVKDAKRSLGNILFYNPDKWGYSHFSFYEEKPIINTYESIIIYEVLYVSQ